MARAKKDNVPVSVRLEKGIFEKLSRFCEDSGQPKTVAVERALEMYIDDYYEKIRQSKQEKLFHEVILQIGNKDDMNAKSEEGQLGT